MFIFGLCFILYFLKLSGTNGFYKSNFYLYQQQSSLLKEASRISSMAPLGNEVSAAIKCSVSQPDS